MLCLQFALFCVFFSEQASLIRLGYHMVRLFNYALLTTALCVNRIRRKVLKYMQAGGFLATVKCAVRCARRSVLCTLLMLFIVLVLS